MDGQVFIMQHFVLFVIKTDVVIIDLEDSVSDQNKELARKSIVEPISERRVTGGPLVVIRVKIGRASCRERV